MLVTVTSRLRIHQGEVLCALLKGNMVVLRFVSMKPIRIPVDDLTEEARRWLLPALAPRDIPDAEELEGQEEQDEQEELELFEEPERADKRRR